VVRFARPLTACEVWVILKPEKAKDENAVEVDTCREYEVAPATPFQERVGVID
jgi:hypothetical protein